MELADSADVEIHQSRKRQVDLLDFRHRQLFVDAAQLRDVVRRQRHRRTAAQRGPRVAIEGEVRRGVAHAAFFRNNHDKASQITPPVMAMSAMLKTPVCSGPAWRLMMLVTRPP